MDYKQETMISEKDFIAAGFLHLDDQLWTRERLWCEQDPEAWKRFTNE